MKRKDKEITGTAEIETIIQKSDVCRIAMVDGNIPYIVTMNFGYSGGTVKKLYFHCAAEGRKLDIIRKNNLVCFEFDTDHQLIAGNEPCNLSMNYKSVVGWGNISILTDDAEKREGLDLIIKHYSDFVTPVYRTETFDRTVVLRLDITEMAGKSN